MECAKCLIEDVFGGQALTRYNCCDCGEEKIWGNTNTPQRCEECSEKNNKCIYCNDTIKI